MRSATWQRVACIMALTLLVALAASACGTTGSSDAADATTEATTEETPVGDTVGDSAEPDTGRMSQGEYDFFASLHQGLVDESLQWTEGYQTCTVIGQTGDLAGFRTCVKDAWDGTDGAMLAAAQNADDLLADTAKACRKAVRKYRNATRGLYNANQGAYEAANGLRFDEAIVAFDQLPKAAKRYAKTSTTALARCEPR